MSVFCGAGRSRVVLKFTLLEREIEEPSNTVSYTGVMGLTNWVRQGASMSWSHWAQERLGTPGSACQHWWQGFWNRNTALWG